MVWHELIGPFFASRGAILTSLMQDASARFGGNPVVNVPIPRVSDAPEIMSAITFLLGPKSTFATGLSG